MIFGHDTELISSLKLFLFSVILVLDPSSPTGFSHIRILWGPATRFLILYVSLQYQFLQLILACGVPKVVESTFSNERV